jgi:phage tail protein X
MARTGQPKANESLAMFAARMGVTVEELYRLNPKLSGDTFVEGFSLNLPDAPAVSSTAQGPAYTDAMGGAAVQLAGPQGTPVANPATGATPVESAAPTGTLDMTDTAGLFNEMLKGFTTAFQTFLSAPSFIREQKTARAGVQAGHPGAIGGFSQQEASFLREMEPTLYSQYGEAVQREWAKTGLTGSVPTLTAADFLKGVNVKEMMEMQPPGSVQGQRRYGPPSIAPRRLRF